MFDLLDFRVWDKEKKQFNYDSLFLFLLFSGLSEKQIADKFDIMRYSGVNDKNGDKLYAGDMVKIYLSASPDEYAPDSCEFVLDENGSFYALAVIEDKKSYFAFKFVKIDENSTESVSMEECISEFAYNFKNLIVEEYGKFIEKVGNIYEKTQRR